MDEAATTSAFSRPIWIEAQMPGMQRAHGRHERDTLALRAASAGASRGASARVRATTSPFRFGKRNPSGRRRQHLFGEHRRISGGGF